MTADVATTTPPPRTRWHRVTRHLTTKLGAFGASAAVLIGSCGPAQCATPVPAPVTTTSVAIRLAAKPVQGPCTYTDTFGIARDGGRVHLGTDIAAAEGNEVYAVADGTITKVYSETTDVLAGNGIRLTQADGTYWFYAHMLSLAPGIAAGTTVAAGQLVGYVGQTGNAGMPHLHLELHPQGGAAVNSYPVIQASGGAC
jgi:murein DD-endopeptidase MepM/ murein hydrolase activator NlpD